MNAESAGASPPAAATWEDAVRWLRTQSDQQDLVRDAYYDDPLVDAAERYACSDEWQAVAARLGPATGRALDVGAGRGIASYALAKHGFRVDALEPDASAVVGAGAVRELAAATQLPIAVTQEVSERLPFPDSSFDIVFARAVLHHTSDLPGACAEFRRVLKPGGRLVAIREHVISRDSDIESFFQRHPLHRLYGGENAFRLDVYLRAIRGAGLQVQEVLPPLASVINFAPHTEQTLRAEVIARLTRGSRGLESLLRTALGPAWAWSGAKRVLAAFDNRPGRLYSFIAARED